MDETKYLILDELASRRDLTRDVESIEPAGDRFRVVFKGSRREFLYGRDRLRYFSRSQEVVEDVSVNDVVQVRMKRKILFGKYLKAFFDEKTNSLLDPGDFKILRGKVSPVLAYVRKVARLVKVIRAEGESQSDDVKASCNTLIPDALDSINEIEVDSPLHQYLTGNISSNGCLFRGMGEYIYPFKCNESQLDAVEKAFSNRLSVIQGPPGTGKTQTILNILMNAVLAGKKVAVVSNNNSAIRNIEEKLAGDNGLDFLLAVLGNNDNCDAFLHNQLEYPVWFQEEMMFSSQDKAQLSELPMRIKSLFAAQNSMRRLEAELNDWSVENGKYVARYGNIEIPYNGRIPSKCIMKLITRCVNRARKHGRVSWWFGFVNVVVWRRFNFEFWHRPIEDVIVALRKFHYEMKCSELREKIDEISNKLKEGGLDELHDRLNELSMRYLKYKLWKRYGRKGTTRVRFKSKSDLRSKMFFEEYPVVLSTVFMVRSFAPEGGFDLLIMDEASQIDPCTGVVALSVAKNVVIVGDDRQLPCVISTTDEEKLEELNGLYEVADAFRYRPGQSILSSIQSAVPNVVQTTLLEHYRCNPYIIGFCNKRFYGGNLILHGDWSNTAPMHILLTVPGNHARNHMNLRQCEEIKDLLMQLSEKGVRDVGVCTPYRDQVFALNAMIDGRYASSTVHKFQGREKDVIVLSTVDNDISQFTANEHLVNVAVSRAKKEFWLVLSSSNRKWDNCIGDLYNYITYYGAKKDSVVEGKIRSVFDVFYSEYQEALKVAGEDAIFDSPAEKIIHRELSKVLEDSGKSVRFSFQMHIPLKEIFDLSGTHVPELTESERKYLKCIYTHVDFVIYDRFGKMPRGGIEVDGFAYHKKGTRQAERDKMKDSIFEKFGMPLLRLSTIGSGENERISEFLSRKIGN